MCRVRVLVALRGLGLGVAESGRLAQMCSEGQCEDMADELEARVAERRAAVAVAITELQHVDAELANLARVIATVPHRHRFGSTQPIAKDWNHANYEIKSGSAGLAIKLTDVGTQEEQLLAAFAECQQGQCSCPTDEYQKLETMDVTTREGKILIQLRPKDGTSFNISELTACLDYTVARTAGDADAEPER